MELALLHPPTPLLKRLSWFDWLFAVIVASSGLFALSRFGEFMDPYEKGILLAAIPSVAAFGWFWNRSARSSSSSARSACSPSASTRAIWRAWMRPFSSST